MFIKVNFNITIQWICRITRDDQDKMNNNYNSNRILPQKIDPYRSIKAALIVQVSSRK